MLLKIVVMGAPSNPGQKVFVTVPWLWKSYPLRLITLWVNPVPSGMWAANQWSAWAALAERVPPISPCDDPFVVDGNYREFRRWSFFVAGDTVEMWAFSGEDGRLFLAIGNQINLEISL
ncbi:hypothetical protein KSP40_PGU021676 [Platanthera guangdongensis]|uniref:Uncharacterized protein n=1 Tax=Platanthera guangdongensis TaxID=2320717 RepID=A0ABR2MWB5_9ASPA